MLHLVESFDDSDVTSTLAGRTFPAVALVEDDQGIRWFVNALSPFINAHTWMRASSSGASALLVPTADGYSAMTIETFMDVRIEAHGGYVPKTGWVRFDHLPSYVELVNTSQSAGKTRSGFVHLHTHSEYSQLDAISTMSEIVDVVVEQGGYAIGIADHGICAGHPDLQKVASQAGLQPIFAMEAYLVDDRFDRPETFDGRLVLERAGQEVDAATAKARAAQDKTDRTAYVSRLRDYWHLVLIATDDEGLRNLWAMSTEAYRDGFYYKPRLDWDTLAKYSTGVIATSACLRGPLTHHGLLEGDEQEAHVRLARLLEIFGDRFYIELHCNQLPEQIKVNHELVGMAQAFQVPLLAAVDSHYPKVEDREAHRVWMSVQTNSDIADESSLFAGGQNYHLKSEDEVRADLAYLGKVVVDEAIANTSVVAGMCTAQVKGESHNPVFAKTGGVDADVDRLLGICMDNWHKTQGKRESQETYLARFEHEFPMIVRKGDCGYFLMTAEQTGWAKDSGILVGPGRGSGGGSLVAYLSGITDLDPVEDELLFERFMTEGRTSLPDFDVDYPSSRKADVQQHVRDRYGEDHVVIVGSVMRLKNKGIINKLGMALKSTLPDSFYMDAKKISKIIEDAEGDTAGLGLSWEDLWLKAGDELQPYRDQYPWLFEMADRLVGRVNTYGQHAAGVIITTDAALTRQLPMRRSSEEGHMIAQFDKDVLEELGFIKFDLLVLKTLDIIQDCIDLVWDRRGHKIDVYSWRLEYQDPQVWEEVAEAHTLGIFQIETTLGTKYAHRMQPRSLADLADLVTIVRPGPRNSGLTETYLRRRHGQEQVTFPDPRMAQVLAKTYGCLLYQEDIMSACMILGGYDSTEADEVRKILGKKKVEKVVTAGREFVSRATANGMTANDATALWSQMSEFAKYCVSGDTEVHLAAKGRYSDGIITVAELYRKLNPPLLPKRQGNRKEKYTGPCVSCGAVKPEGRYRRGLCSACDGWLHKFRDVERGLFGLTVHHDGRIRPCRILDVLKQESTQTWTVTLASGQQITATANHEHLTPDGLRRVDKLQVGDRLVINAGYENLGHVPERDRLTRGVRTGSGYIDGGCASLMLWTAQASAVCEECSHDGSVHRLERAHLDSNRQNNDWSNLRMLCVSCHKKYDNRDGAPSPAIAWGKGYLSGESEIVSIEPRGVEPVYSVVMDDPHIWIANGIATSNSFNRAHAFAYAVLGYWAAWLKFHYPVEFLTSALSSIDKDRIPDFVKEARRMGFSVLPPDINESGHGFRAGSLSVRYGLDAVKGIGMAAAAIEAGQPFLSFEDFMERMVEPKGSKVNRGHVVLLARIGAFDSLVPNRRGLEKMLLDDKTGVSTQCVRKNLAVVGAPNDLPCTFDWATEPPLINHRTGKKMKAKAPPKRCTKACRQYIAPPPVKIEEETPYTKADVREIEQELLGVFLSSTPFDMLDSEQREITRSQAELLMRDQHPEGQYLISGILTKMRSHRDLTGREMGFLAFDTEVSTVDVTCFSSTWLKYKRELVVGSFYAAEVENNARGNLLYALMPHIMKEN